MKSVRNLLAWIGFVILIYLIGRFFQEQSDPFNHPPPPGDRGEILAPVREQRDFVHIEIDALKILKIPVDVLETNPNEAQLQLFILISDGQEIHAKFDYFGGKYRSVRKNEEMSLGKVGAYFDARHARDKVFVWFLAVDSDELDQFLEFSLNHSTDYALEVFANRIQSTSALGDLADWNLWARVVSMVAEAGLGIWQINDLIGQQVIELNRSENWNASRRRIETDTIRIEYDIIYSDERPSNIEPLAAPTKAPDSSRAMVCGIPQTQFHVGETIQVDFNHDGALRILKSPDAGPKGTIMQAYDNYRLQLLDGPVCGKWNGQPVWYWRVHYKGRAGEAWGWAAEGVPGDSWMCPLSNPECGS
jgi:hypothetical protein